jgi:hypothetical protein
MPIRRGLALVLAAALLVGCGGPEVDDGSNTAARQRTDGLGS